MFAATFRLCIVLMLLCFASHSGAQQSSEAPPAAEEALEGAEEATSTSGSDPAKSAAEDSQLEATSVLPADASDAARQLAGDIDGMNSWITQLQLVTGQLREAGDVDIEALTYRRDERAIELLSHANELAVRIAQLPPEDNARDALGEYLLSALSDLSTAVYNRVDQLQEEITKERDALPESGGSDRELAEARLYSLEATRDHFLRLVADHIATRRQFEMPVDDMLEPLQTRLLIQAESVAGRLSFLRYTVQDLSSKLALDKANSDLQSAYSEVHDAREHNLRRLRDLVDIMTTVEMDTAQYRSILVKEDTGISLDIIKPGVLSVLFTQWLTAMEKALLTKGPDILLNILLFFTVLVAFFMLSRLTRRAVKAALGRGSIRMTVLMRDTLISLSAGMVMLLGVLMALSQIGVSLGPMLAGLGIAGFIIGFALQETLSNFAAGAMILIYRPYDVGDFVEVPGASGVVKKMNLVSTTITTYDNQRLVVPNGKIWGDVIKNVTGQTVRRVDMEFGIGYSDDIPKAEAVLTQLAAEHELVLDDPETLVKVGSLGDSSVNLLLRPWVKTADYWTVYWDLTRAVKMRFDAEGISIPFPQRDVHFYHERGPEADPDSVVRDD